MQSFPHIYAVNVDGAPQGHLQVSCDNLPGLTVASPVQFDGPGDQWSPEGLFLAAVADCFVLTFRTIATMSKLEWLSIHCESQGELDKVEGKIKFTKIRTRASLTIPASADSAKAERLLKKAEGACLISNSVNAELFVEVEVIVAG